MSPDLNVIRPSPFYADVTPSDTADHALRNNRFPTGISIGVAGTLTVHDLDGTSRLFSATELAVGIVHPIRTRRVLATGTTATEIKLYWDN